MFLLALSAPAILSLLPLDNTKSVSTLGPLPWLSFLEYSPPWSLSDWLLVLLHISAEVSILREVLPDHKTEAATRHSPSHHLLLSVFWTLLWKTRVRTLSFFFTTTSVGLRTECRTYIAKRVSERVNELVSEVGKEPRSPASQFSVLPQGHGKLQLYQLFFVLFCFK